MRKDTGGVNEKYVHVWVRGRSRERNVTAKAVVQGVVQKNSNGRAQRIDSLHRGWHRFLSKVRLSQMSRASLRRRSGIKESLLQPDNTYQNFKCAKL